MPQKLIASRYVELELIKYIQTDRCLLLLSTTPHPIYLIIYPQQGAIFQGLSTA